MPKCGGGVAFALPKDWAMAKRALDIGFYISISGIIAAMQEELEKSCEKCR